MPWPNSKEETQPRLEKVGDEDEFKDSSRVSVHFSQDRERQSLGRRTQAEGYLQGNVSWVGTGPKGNELDWDEASGEIRCSQGKQEGCKEGRRNPINSSRAEEERETAQNDGPSHQEVASIKEDPI